MLVNKKALADILGYSERTLTEWQDESPPLPMTRKGARGEDNEYDTAEAVKWLVNRTLARAGKAESQRDREARLRGDLLELELARERNVLVPSHEVQPVWEARVLAAAAFMMSRASRLAGILEATPGIEAKREVLKREDASFLAKLGTDGERIHAEIQSLLEKLAAGEADAFMRRIAGHDDKQNPAGPPEGGLGEADPA